MRNWVPPTVYAHPGGASGMVSPLPESTWAEYQLVDQLVDYHHCAQVKTIKVGAFEAKTHLSQLLDEVEQGAVVRITRRGSPVAVLRQDEARAVERVLSSLSSLRSLCRHRATLRQVLEWRDVGRKL